MLESAGFMTQDAAGNGLLQIAVLYGHIEVSELLLKNGFNINSVDRNHGTALQAAIYMGRNDIIDSLLNRRKSNTNLEAKAQLKVNTRGGYYGCALQVAAYRANSKLVKDLINDFRADVNVAGGKYGYPLQAAVRTGRRDVVGKRNGAVQVLCHLFLSSRASLHFMFSEFLPSGLSMLDFPQNAF